MEERVSRSQQQPSPISHDNDDGIGRGVMVGWGDDWTSFTSGAAMMMMAQDIVGVVAAGLLVIDDLFRKLERTKAQGRSGETWVKKVSMSRKSKGLVCVAEIFALELSLTVPIGINEWLSIYH